MRKTLSTQVVSISGNSSSTFSTSFIPEDSRAKKLRGSFFMVGSFESEAEPQLKEGLINSWREKYYASEGSILFALQTLTEKAVEIRDLIVAVVWGNILYLCKKGGSEAFLYRGKLKRIKISKSASGHLEAEDALVLTTEGFIKVIGQEELEKHLKSGGAKTLEEKIKGKEEEAVVITLEEAEEWGEEEKIVFIDMGKKPTFVAKGLGGKKVLSWLVTGLKTFIFLGWGLIKLFWLLINKLFRRKRRKSYLVSPKRFKWGLPQLLIVLVVILLLSVAWGIQSRNKEQSLGKFNSFYDLAKASLEEANSLYKLNPIRAKELLVQGRVDFEKAKKLNLDKNKVAELEALLGSTQEIVNRNYKIESLPVFYDLALLGKNVRAIDLELVREGLLIVDEDSSIYLLDTKKKAAKVLRSAGESYITKKAVIAGDLVYLLTSEGVFSYNFRIELLKKVIEKDSSWREVVDIGFWEGNLYLLDQGAKVILKYTPARENFSKTTFAREESFAQANSLSIDGLVWVLEKNGLIKLLRGKKEDFSLKGMDKAFKEGWEVKTNESSGSLYVLDRGNSRAVVIDKSGIFEASYEGESFKTAVSLGVDESKNSLLILTAQKIYMVDLK